MGPLKLKKKASRATYIKSKPKTKLEMMTQFHLFLAGKLNNMSQIINAIRLSNELILEQLIHTYIISFNTVFLKKINYKINTKSKYILLNNLFI